MDIEPYHDSHLPFYQRLRTLLNAGGKLLTMFTGRSNNPDIFLAADIVVYSAYDQTAFAQPLAPATWGSNLYGQIDQLLDTAESVGGKALIGIAAAASTNMFETVGGACTNRTGYPMQDYITAAGPAMGFHHCRDSNLGASLWVMGQGNSVIYAGCTFTPYEIKAPVWSVFSAYNWPCGSPTAAATPTYSRTATPTYSRTATPTYSRTATPTASPSDSATATATVSATTSRSSTPSTTRNFWRAAHASRADDHAAVVRLPGDLVGRLRLRLLVEPHCRRGGHPHRPCRHP
jgi:hypothetical protein